MPKSPGAPALITGSAGLADAAQVLERLASWLRRTTPRVEWNSVALSTLSLLVAEGPARVTDLVAAERITQPGMTNLVGRLAAAGLVERSADPGDGRVTMVRATGAGRDYLEGVHQARATIIAKHLACLPDAHQEAIMTALDALDSLARRPLQAAADRGRSPLRASYGP